MKSPKHYGLETGRLCPEDKCFGLLVRKTDDTLACPQCGIVPPPEPQAWYQKLLDALFKDVSQ